MPTTYSPSLRLSDIGDGEQAGTWGAITDTNICTLLESAIAGKVQVAVTSTNVTLTANNGADDQSRHAVIELTGTSTGSRNVIVPSAEKQYVVWNNTTGGYDHTIITAAGTGTLVPNGKKAILYCDATNVVEAVNYISTLLPTAGGTMTGSLVMPDGSVGTPAINFSADTNTGIRRSAADTFAVVAGGADRLTVNTTTTAVGGALTVAGTTALTGATTFTGAATFNGAATANAAVTINSTLAVTGAVNFSGNSTIGSDSADTVTVNATSTFNGPVTFAGVPTFTGNVVIGDSGADTLSVVSTSTFTGAATFNGTNTFGGAAAFNAGFTGTTSTLSGTATFNGAAVFNGNVTLGNATGDAITVTGNTTVGASTTLTKSSAGSFISHGSSAHTSGVITVSASSPSGGSNGDIWFQI
jgi:hypothetical protein